MSAERLVEIRHQFDHLANVGYTCECQVGGVDAASVDADWLHVLAGHGADLLAEVDRLTRLAMLAGLVSAHDCHGERLPSDDASDSAQVDPDTFARGTASAFRDAGRA